MEIEESNDDLSNDWQALINQGAALDEKLNPQVTDSGNEPKSMLSEPEDPEIESGALMGEVVQTVADIFAPNWQMQAEESEALGNVYGKLLDKYMPDSGLNKYGLEISAVLVTGMFLKSRKGVPMKIENEKPEENPEQKADASESETTEESQEIVNQSSSNVLIPKAVKS